MTEIVRRCAECRLLPQNCKCRDGFQYYRRSAPATVAEAYEDLRAACDGLENLLTCVANKDSKRLDKAVTVMKVGFKIIKKVLRSQGAVGNLKVPQPAQQGTTERVQ